MKVIRDAEGNVINIGEWDYAFSEDADGSILVGNPIPVGSTEHEEEVITGADGGRYVLGDPRAGGD